MADVITIQTSRGPFTVSRQYADRFKAFLEDPEWGEYAFDPKQSGGYNPRNIAGTNTPSQHAFGNAIDINWTRNARGTAGDLDPTLARTLAKRHGLTWGGDWTNPDPMHFEVARDGPIPMAQRGIASFAGVPKPAADMPSRMALGGPKPMPTDPQTGQWVPEEWIARRGRMADQMWSNPISGGKYSWAEGLLSGLGSGLGNLDVRNSLQGNQALQQGALRNAAGAQDAPSLARSLIGSGVPGLASQGVGLVAQNFQKEADRRAQLEQQKQLFEYQRRLQLDLKKQEMEQNLELMKKLRNPQAAAPGVVAANPAAPANPNDAFVEELLGGAGHKSPSQDEKAIIAMALGEKGKAVDALMEKGADLKDHQTKDASFAERMLRAEAGLREVVPTDKSGKFLKYDPTSSIYKFLPDWNVTNSQEWQQYSRNAREGIAAILRKDTGAAVTKEEWDWYFPMYYPQPGDSAEVVADKQRARISVARGLRAASGPAFEQMFPRFNEQLRQRLTAAGANLTPPAAAAQPGANPGATTQYSQIKRNPKTGELAGYNSATGKWEIIKPSMLGGPPAETSPPSLGEIAAP